MVRVGRLLGILFIIFIFCVFRLSSYMVKILNVMVSSELGMVLN